MEITLDYLHEKFDEFNNLYFENKLPRILIQINNNKSRFGYFRFNRYSGSKVISISRYDGLRKEHAIQRTLIHEMIHYWQYLTYKDTDHKYTFKAMSKKIYKLSKGKFDIQRTSNPDIEDGLTIVERVNHNVKPVKVFLVKYLTTNEYWLCASASTNIANMRTYFNDRPNNWEIIKEWYTTDNRLIKLNKNRQTRCIKGRKISVNEVCSYTS